MSEDKNTISNKNTEQSKKGSFNSGKKRGFGSKKRFSDRPKEEFEQRILDIARVTRVVKGGQRMSFRACVAIGDKKGRVAVALGKGTDVTLAMNKAVSRAKKDIVHVPIVNGSIPHEVYNKFGSAKILMKPASVGRGIIAGGVSRIIFDLAGIDDISSKILGTNNKVNNAKCTIAALSKLKKINEKKDVVKDEKKEESKIDKNKK
jgi:small subunit ribosomal protein S5